MGLFCLEIIMFFAITVINQNVNAMNITMVTVGFLFISLKNNITYINMQVFIVSIKVQRFKGNFCFSIIASYSYLFYYNNEYLFQIGVLINNGFAKIEVA